MERRAAMPDVSGLFAEANEQIMNADNKEKLQRLLAIYERILERDPSNYEALWSLGRYNVVMVLAYTESRGEKERYNLAAINYCEQAMNTHPEFKALSVGGGSERVGDACRVLTKREIAPLYYWYAGMGSYWKECLPFLQRIRNVHLAGGIKKVMTRMLEIDPLWAGGHPYYAWGFYYLTLPRMLGGSLKKAEVFMDKAVDAGPKWLYAKWGRAKYLYTRKKDKRAFTEDLEWVIAQDPREMDSPYPANVHFQRDAKAMLSRIDDLFA
jgi:tetratricopeptide (TPR) repeat protein